MTTVAKKHAGSFRLNVVSRKTEAVFHLVLAVFALACIIPFIFVSSLSDNNCKSSSRLSRIRPIWSRISSLAPLPRFFFSFVASL